MNIAISRYRLSPSMSHGGELVPPRSGALLRVEFQPGLVGYADCHPWPELGDPDLEQQLGILRSGGATALLERSLALARVDAEARAAGEWLFEDLEVPESHATFPYALGLGQSRTIAEARLDLVRALGFGVIKLKVGRSPVIELSELARLIPQIRERELCVRFDFNEGLSLDDVSGYLSALISESGDDLAWIDWIEDPCPFDVDHWERLRGEFGLPLALDRPGIRLEAYRELPVDVLILKPAVMDPAATFEIAAELDVPVAVTSYLDHPVGQVGAAWVAAKALAEGVPLVSGGVATHLAYETNGFSEGLLIERGRLIPSFGTGLGFDDLLEDTPWKTIVRAAQ